MSKKSSASRLTKALKWAFFGVASVATAGVAASGCLDRPLCDTDCRPNTLNVFVDSIQQDAIDKIDLLFMIDNSSSMADKQRVLAEAVPDLVSRLVNPVCVAPDGSATNVAPLEQCPDGTQREFKAVNDIHIGVITSSLGAAGSEHCPLAAPELNDRGYLLGMLQRANTVPGLTSGFLSWLPQTTDSSVLANDATALGSNFRDLVSLAGETGCGFEASLEAWFRFLVDPAPYADIGVAPCGPGNPNPCATPTGVDMDLIAQRKAFLRSDSLVAVIMLTDENDCSIQPVGQNFYPLRRDLASMWRASSVCAMNPNDRCCYSCGVPAPEGCADPACDGAPLLDPKEDPANLRCWNQKQRYGVDFLYPISRYVNALREPLICDPAARLDLDPNQCPTQPIANPLFQDLNQVGSGVRQKQFVFFAGIVGVPWQDIERTVDPATQMPLTPEQRAAELRYKTGSDLASAWPIILGDPDGATEGAAPILPTDTLMHELRDPRIPGSNPVTMEALQPPSAGLMANKINGHEWANPDADDLQYACIFPLAEELDCSNLTEGQQCDCKGTQDQINAAQNPLCQAQDGSYSSIQRYAKAYPGIRHLQVLKELGGQSIVASICARNLTNPNAADYGYRPAIAAIIDKLKGALQGRCLPREGTVTERNGVFEVPCSVIEAIPGKTSCNSPGRGPAAGELVDPALNRLKKLGRCADNIQGIPTCTTADWTLCEIKQDPTGQCLTRDAPDREAVGWCYIDEAKRIGNAELIPKECPPTERRLLRFVGDKTPAPGAVALIACLGADLQETGGGTMTGAGGEPAMPMPMVDGGMTPAP